MRGRKSSIRYYDSKNGYFTEYQGKKYRLATGPDDGPSGPTFLKALDEFKKLMESAHAPEAGGQNTLRVIVDLYLRHVAETKKPKTLSVRRLFLLPFLGHDKTAEMRVGDLKKPYVESYIAHMKEPRPHKHCPNRLARWRSGGVRNFISCLHACLNWAVKRELIPANPLKGLEAPAGRSRGGECRVTPAMHRKALKGSKTDFRQLLAVLEATGCRPSELFNAEARHFDAALGAIVYRGRAHLEEGEVSHKTSNRDKDRIVFLTGEALQLVKELVRKYPEGPLFRTKERKGHASGRWTDGSVHRRVRRLRERAGLPAAFSLSSYRHEAHTAYLEAGGGIEDLAAIRGNTPEVIRRHYSHLTDNPQRLRKLAEEFRAKVAMAAAAPAVASTPSSV
jgi:integrase